MLIIAQPPFCATDGDPGVDACLQRLSGNFAPIGALSFAAHLENLTDELLDANPAASLAGLELRLDSLCAAAEELGRWAQPSKIIERALALTHQLH